MEKEKKLLKDWFDESATKYLAGQFERAYPDFPRPRFVKLATRNLISLEFAGRIKQFSDGLADCLPAHPPEALDILTRSLPDVLPGEEAVKDGYLQWPLGQYIADHGVDHFEESFRAMIALTQRFSAEFAVRPFAREYPEKTIACLLELTTHPSAHVRRWCSEGVRPRLPWGGHLRHLIEDPSPLWPILEALKDDPSLYVRRSVANNLNDIAKDHPDQVVLFCKKWMKDAGPEREWVIKHALRSLIKDGRADALEVMGYGAPEKIACSLSCSSSVRVGESVELSARLRNQSEEPQDLVVDFVVHYVRKNGKTSGKVFKWTNLRLEAGELLELRKNHSMRKTTIRALYPGLHRVELQLNGKRLAASEFELSLS